MFCYHVPLCENNHLKEQPAICICICSLPFQDETNQNFAENSAQKQELHNYIDNYVAILGILQANHSHSSIHGEWFNYKIHVRLHDAHIA